MNISEKSALVLGGVGGIGLAVVENLVKSGVRRLGVIDVVEEEVGKQKILDLLVGFNGLQLSYVCAEVEDEKKLREVMTDIAVQLNGVDIVVNSVGILQENDPKKMIMINFVS